MTPPLRVLDCFGGEMSESAKKARQASLKATLSPLLGTSNLDSNFTQ